MRASAPLLIAALVLWSVPAAPAASQARPDVAVRFELRDSTFRRRFGPEASTAERRIADSITAALSDRTGFVHLVAGDTSAHALVFALDRADRSSSTRFPERGIWARLETPTRAVPEFYWKMLRPADAAAAPVGSVDALASEVARLFQDDVTVLQQRLLSEVPISQSGLPWTSPPGWALPFLRSELCMKKQTRLRLVNEIVSGAMTVERVDTATVTADFAVNPPVDPRHEPFLQRAFSQLSRDPYPALAQAILDGTAVIRAVYVVSYEPDLPCKPEPIAPLVNGGGDR